MLYDSQMDFEHAGVEVSQEDISLEDSTERDNIPMDMDNVQEQHTLLEGGNEEVISKNMKLWPKRKCILLSYSQHIIYSLFFHSCTKATKK